MRLETGALPPPLPSPPPGYQSVLIPLEAVLLLVWYSYFFFLLYLERIPVLLTMAE